MGFYDAFFGSDQSLYTAYAIIAAIISICVTILFTSTDIPFGSRLLMILFVIITLVPSIFLTLFEITCIVTGGTEPNNWWCYTFGWILAAFIIIYCIFVVIISIISLITYNKAIDNVNNDEEKNKVNPQEANDIAKQIMATQKPVEKFYAENSKDQQFGQLGNMFPTLGSSGNQLANTMQNMVQQAMESQKIAKFTNMDSNHIDSQHDPYSEGFTDEEKAKIASITSGGMIATFDNKEPTPKPEVKPEVKAATPKAGFADYNGVSTSSLQGDANDSLATYPDIFASN